MLINAFPITTFCFRTLLSPRFPPLSILTLVAVASQTYSYQAYVGKLIVFAQEKGWDCYIEPINRECEGIAGAFASALNILYPCAVVFFCLFVFDAIGDSSGSTQGAIGAAAIPVIVLLAQLGYRVVRVLLTRTAQRDKDKIRYTMLLSAQSFPAGEIL